MDNTMYYFENNSFAGIEPNGRKYSIIWLAAAYCDDEGNWTYYGANSTKERYIGWSYHVEWYDANGVKVCDDVTVVIPKVAQHVAHTTGTPIEIEIDTNGDGVKEKFYFCTGCGGYVKIDNRI
jgi:hypothetical protein